MFHRWKNRGPNKSKKFVIVPPWRLITHLMDKSHLGSQIWLIGREVFGYLLPHNNLPKVLWLKNKHYPLVFLWVERAQRSGSCLRLLAQMAARTADIWRWSGWGIQDGSLMLALEAGCQLRVPSHGVQVAWVCHSMVWGSWGGRPGWGFKRKDAEAARPGKGWAYFPALFTISYWSMQSQAYEDSRGSSRFHLMRGWQCHIAENTWHGRCFSYLFAKGSKFSVMASPSSLPRICKHLWSLYQGSRRNCGLFSPALPILGTGREI